jgi:hypothetical protein
MGANAQTSVPLFVANSVLTASQQNISAATGVPVFATTVTRDAAFGGSNKVLAEGQLCYLESTDVVQYYTGAAWATVGPASAGGLVLVKAETAFTGQTSFNVANVFSATYNNYLIWIRNIAATSNGGLRFQLSGGGTATASGYSYQRFIAYGTNTAASRVGNTTSAYLQEGGGAYFSQAVVSISNPFSGQMTYTSTDSLSDAGYFTPAVEVWAGNQQTAVANQDGFTLLSVTGTITGTYTVYGYAKS